MANLRYVNQQGKLNQIEPSTQNKDVKMVVEQNQTKIKVIIDVINPIVLKDLRINVTVPISFNKVQTNGYQTWTDSDLVYAHEIYKPVNPIFGFFFKNYGDYGFVKTTGKRGQFNSHNYCLLKNDNQCFGLNSVDESNGYTIYQVDIIKQACSIRKDLEGTVLKSGESMVVLEVQLEQGDERLVYQRMFPVTNSHKISGWTSWYNYYNDISYDILVENLENIHKAKLPYDIFQIDDGYQTAVGDWLSLKENFSQGLKSLVDKTNDYQMKAGLWLAPFVAERKSRLYKEHKEWFVKIEGKILKGGWNPGWSGNFYTLNIYNDDVRNYLKDVFRTVREEWGFDFVKLDFLYAIASKPYNGKNRGQIMRDGVLLLRELCGDMQILGCGVPLGSAKDIFDYCRIGADVATYWEDKLLNNLHYRERVSTFNSLKSAIGRAFLNGSYFINDPDVFINREQGNKMNQEQKLTLFIVNNLLGGLVFTSDNVGLYSENQLKRIRTMYPQHQVEIVSLDKKDDAHYCLIKALNQKYEILINLSGKEQSLSHNYDVFDGEKVVAAHTHIRVNAYETLVLPCLEVNEKILWSNQHVLPGGNIKGWFQKDGNVQISLYDQGVAPTYYYILVKSQLDNAKLIEQWGQWYIYRIEYK